MPVRSRTRRAALALLCVALSGCRVGEVPLPDNALLDAARTADHPRARLGSLPVAPDEHRFDLRCGIEAVQGATVTDARADNSVGVDLPATMSGWAFAPDEVAGIPEAWLRMVPLAGSLAAAEFPLVLHFPRPDVVAARGSSAAAFSGFTRVTVEGLAPGPYEAQVVFASPAGRWVCTNSRRVDVR